MQGERDTAVPHPPAERGAPVAFVLAVLAHVLLFALLFFGIRWQNKPADTVEAELWTSLPPANAPQRAPAKAEPPPEPEPPRPEPPKAKPEPRPEPRPVEPPKTAKPDIALEEEKRKKKREAEKREREEEQKKKKEKEERERKEQEKEKEQKKLAEAQKKRAEDDKKKREKLAELQHKQILDDMRKQDMERIAGVPGPASPTAGARGGPKGDPNWAARVRQCIKPHMVFNEGSATGNLIATFRVQLVPGGEQLGDPKLAKSSGNSSFDAAVERAIQRCDPFPLPSGAFQSEVQIDYRLKE
jgi:colicin import membrane protein